jgi:murein DD-endopeptidase MepM/ murein hydrolase activator NlpD
MPSRRPIRARHGARPRRWLGAVVAFLVAVLVAGVVLPADAASSDPRAQRDAARARRAQLARQLDALEASEDDLEQAVAALDAQVAAVGAQVNAARQAARVAEAEVAAATQRADETKARIDSLTRALVGRAVARFMSPRTDDLGLDDTEDLAASTRRRVLLDTVAANDGDLLDQLRSAEEDYERERAAAEAAAAVAAERRADIERKLASLQDARAEQRRLESAVEQRRSEVLAEIDKQAAAEAELTRIINARAAAFVGNSSATSSGCIWPTRGRVSSEFGSRWGRLHAGIDISAPTGTPIWAAKAGEVIFAGQQSGYGNVVIIAHGGGLTTLYGHQSRIGVRDGQVVRQGQVIGQVGNTGRSTGPHLHFETRYGGTPRNPRGCLG